jgi:hypothetical protein
MAPIEEWKAPPLQFRVSPQERPLDDPSPASLTRRALVGSRRRVFQEGTPVFRQNYLFTSESVSEGHPDKVCDRISDEIVDLVYREAKKAGMDPWKVRVACETLATTNRVVIAGEVRVPDTLLKKGKDGKILTGSRRTLDREWTMPPTGRARRGLAIRASCSDMPAGRRLI